MSTSTKVTVLESCKVAPPPNLVSEMSHNLTFGDMTMFIGLAPVQRITEVFIEYPECPMHPSLHGDKIAYERIAILSFPFLGDESFRGGMDRLRSYSVHTPRFRLDGDFSGPYKCTYFYEVEISTSLPGELCLVKSIERFGDYRFELCLCVAL
ncbi:hypothetical protein LIER_37961 [Lithospermum erythrorhizon]|uniref:Uncharacterized protein n=1 Tax=Lithospermum erythrorhizon TaxID=34254 RepID=A0AAV3PVN2_LITER